MGNKGDKMTKDSVLSAELIVSKLEAIGGVSTKKMFGGHGIFHDGKMFGIVDSKGQSFLKADDSNRGDYEGAGSHQHSRMPYFSIPDDVLNNQDTLTSWVEKSIAISK
jgi:DNA transformation protein